MLTREPGRWTTLLLAAAGGAVTELAFPGRSWWPAAILGMALLFLALRRHSAGWGAVVGLTWGLAFFFPHLYWAYVSVGAVPWVALVLLESAFVAGFGYLWGISSRAPLLRRSLPAAAVAFATAWTVVEQARSVFPFGGFPWGRLAFSQTDAPTLGLAALGGAPLVSAVVAGAGALVAQGVLRVAVRRVRPRALPSAAGAIALAAAVTTAGLIVPLPTSAEHPAGAPGGSDTLRIAAVQGNIARLGLDAFSRAREVLENHVVGTEEVARAVGPGGVDLVLWPENAADLDPRADARARELVVRAADAIEAPILLGTLRFDEQGRYNDSVLWTPEEGPVAVYTKQHPAPFAEYIPMRSFARLFTDKVDLVRTDMLPGTEVGVVPVAASRLGRTVLVADAICFEVAYDGLVRSAVLAGGEIIVVQTNNASFGLTQESVQQLAMTRLRAVEHGRTAVQVSTVGVSGIIAPDGAVLARAELFEADQLVETVPLRSTITIADRLGVLPQWAAAVVAALALASGVAATRRARVTPAGSA